MRTFFRRLCSAVMHIAAAAVVMGAFTSALAQETIVTNNAVPLKEVVSPNGFVHPGISCNAQTLSVMREKVLAGASPWVEYFEGMRRTRYADPNRKPAHVEQIVNDGGIYGFAYDAQLAWTQTILYVVTGNEQYRKLPVDIIKWYGSRTDKSFFPTYFSDSHIKIGKYVYTMCTAVDILRTIPPKNKNLAVTQEMVDALQKYCMLPIRKNCIERNTYFMNQHSYAIMGYLASTIMGDDTEGYKQAVEWTTVNATTPNWGRSGSIKDQIRLVTHDDRTGKAVAPNLQLVEMGRDMPHAEGNITNLLMMSKTIDFQKTKVDPVTGTVTTKTDGVSPLHFLDDRLARGAALYEKYNMGYGLRWVPTYSETDPKNPDYHGRYDQISPRARGSFGSAFHYYYLKGMGFDLKSGPLRFIKLAFDATAAGRDGVRSGGYLDTLHNYGFDFWIGLPAAASDAAPDPAKAKRALAVQLPPWNAVEHDPSVPGLQVEDHFVDLSAHAQPGDIYPGSPTDIPLQVMRDPDDTRYVRMKIDKGPRTMVLAAHFPRSSGLRVRCDSLVKLGFYLDEDFSQRGGCIAELYVPATRGTWVEVIPHVEGNGLVYVQATPLAGPVNIDFDRIDTDPEQVLPISFADAGASEPITTYVGATVARSFKVTQDRHLRGGASWTPGRVGNALRLSGDRQFAILNPGILDGLSTFSISAWIKPHKLDPWARVFDFGNGRDSYMFLAPTDGRAVKFAIRTPSSPKEQAVLGHEPLHAGVWQHVAITFSGNTAILYVNGQEVGRNSNLRLKLSDLWHTQRNYIGKSQFADPYFTGSVDDLTIFNRALSADEIKSIFASNSPIDPTTSDVHYKFDPATAQSEHDKVNVQYKTTHLPARASFDRTTGALQWTPSAEQVGQHALYVTAVAGGVLRTLPVDIYVAKDLQAALEHVAQGHDPAARYIATTEQAFQAALKARDLVALQRAVDDLQLLNPRLSDGTLDYRVASGSPEFGLKNMADGDPFTWGGVWGFDKSLTMDFGNAFKVKCDAFRMLTRDGFPSRMYEAVVYGSNDRKHWTLLTENSAASSCDWQTLKVKEQERSKPWRYLRLFKPASTSPIFEVAEFRILGQRVQDYSPDVCVAYIKGYDDGTFRPEQKMTRAEAVCALAGLVDDYTDPGAYTCAFSDVPRSAPYYDDVAYMSSKGIGHTWSQPVKYVTADAQSRFHPKALITRGQLAGIMSRMQWLKGDDGPELKDVTADTPNAPEIRRVLREGWLTADESGCFHPDAPVTRAQFVVAVNRMIHRTQMPREGMPSFTDVNTSYPAYQDIMKATTTYPIPDAKNDQSSMNTAKTFIDYFLPMPIIGTLSKDVWGAAAVGPRDPKNGLEDATMKAWDYWDGKIIKGGDGKYHMFASRWEQSRGHRGWWQSKAVHAVSDRFEGPYVDRGLCWPDDDEGKGHNVTALQLPDGRYAIVISETRPGMVFVSNDLDGPWKKLGVITVDGDPKWHASNEIILVRPDGRFEMFGRGGVLWISEKGILGPYAAQGPSIYPAIKDFPKQDLRRLEDPVLWSSGGLYHIVVNNWGDRKAYHLTSRDGISDWTFRGLAYDPSVNFVRYTDGTVNRWAKLERPSVYIEDGHVKAITLAVIDVQKEAEHGNDGHGSKIIVIPFDGAALDRDLSQEAQ